MRMSSHVIDLTVDSPEDDQSFRLPFDLTRAGPPPSMRPASHHHHHHYEGTRRHHPRPPPRDQMVGVSIVPNSGRGVLPDIRGLGRRLVGYLGAEIIGYQLNAIATAGQERVFHQEPARQSPKPALEEPPKARAGFTRETNAEPEDDHVVVCPCCDEELAYDPKDTVASSNTNTDSKKRKRVAGEHHFWALKKCGHVCSRLNP
jgi:hypothetical protein